MVEPAGNLADVVDPRVHGQITILAIVRNSCSVIGRSLQRRCAIAAAPMLPASATIRADSPRQAAKLLRAKCASPQPIVSTTLVLSVGIEKRSSPSRTMAPLAPSVTDTL